MYDSLIKVFYRNYGVQYHDLDYIKVPVIKKAVVEQLYEEGKITKEEYEKHKVE